MKKILYILCAMAAFASCSKEELPTEGGQNPDGSYTFNLGIEEPDYAPKTRAAVTMSRYMLEIYEGDLTATPVKMTNADGVFNVEMKKNTDYVCLFWADNGTDYTASDLKAVKLVNETNVGTAAYATKVTVNSKTFNGAITLKRAVAELSFIDKNGLTEASNTLKITYPYASATFNVGDGTVTHATGSTVRTITNITPPAQATTAFTTDFVLAPTAAGAMQWLKFQLNNEDEKTIAETVIQANYKTKITGEYWKLNVGDFYYKDKTFSSTYTADAQNPCIGIVFWVDPANGKTGKIVSLDKAANENWADAQTWTSNTVLPSGMTWRVPTKEELQYLYCGYTGVPAQTWVDGSYSATEVAGAKDAFNAKLTAASAETLSNDFYWSSTERNDTSAWSVSFASGSTYLDRKTSNFSVRVVSAF